MKSDRSAISLIEVTLVILVIGILAAVATPRFSDAVRVMRLEAAARQMAAHIDYIRSVAINEGRTTELACDNQLHAYVGDVDSPELAGQPLSVSITQDFDSTFSMTADFDDATTLRFDFEGIPHVSSTPMTLGIIELASGNDRFAVSIAAGTGATSVQRLPAGDGNSETGQPHEDVGDAEGQVGATP